MIPTIGLLIAAYAVARLVQVPLEHASMPVRTKVLALAAISAVGIAVIGFCVFVLLVSGASVDF